MLLSQILQSLPSEMAVRGLLSQDMHPALHKKNLTENETGLHSGESRRIFQMMIAFVN